MIKALMLLIPFMLEPKSGFLIAKERLKESAYCDLQEGQSLSYDTYCMNEDAIAELMTRDKTAKETCENLVVHRLNVQKIFHDEELGRCKLSNDLLREEEKKLLDLRDREIADLSEKQDSTKFYIVGASLLSFAFGVTATYFVSRVFD